MKALITGSEGFVGGHLRQELEANGYEVVRVDLMARPSVHVVDLTDAASTRALICETAPDVIFHLAAQANVGLSWKEPQRTFQMNVISAINVLEACRETRARLLLVGSSDQYGPMATENVSEEIQPSPSTPYAISKQAQESIATLYARTYGMWVCMTRSFNHGGAGQRPGFLISDFAHGIVQVERGEQEALLVGNLSAQRDFTHVKDIVRAYRLIMEKGRPGEIYNVGSGKAWRVQDILDRMISKAKCRIPVRQDASRMRPSDIPIICCDRSKLTRDTGWQPEKTLDDILEDALNAERKRFQGDEKCEV